MQRMSDMLTRWLEGAMRRAENETDADADSGQDPADQDPADQDPADLDELDRTPRSAGQAGSAATVEERVEASLQNVANLRLTPSSADDVSDAVADAASQVVNNVLRSASREAREDISAPGDDLADHKPEVDFAPTLTDGVSKTSENVAASDSALDSPSDCHRAADRDSKLDSNPSNSLHLKPESDVTNSCYMPKSVDEPIGLMDNSLPSPFAGASSQVPVDVDEKNEACCAENVELNPAKNSAS